MIQKQIFVYFADRAFDKEASVASIESFGPSSS